MSSPAVKRMRQRLVLLTSKHPFLFERKMYAQVSIFDDAVYGIISDRVFTRRE